MAALTALFSTNLDTVFNQFVVVGAATRGLRSVDGETWVSQGTLTGMPALTNMAFGKNILVALGQTVNTAGMVYTTFSAEALASWTNRPLAPATGIANIGWQDVAFGNNIWVAVGGGIDTTVRTTGTCTMVSSNSANWTKYTGLTAADWRCIAFGQGKFVTLSYGSNLARFSTDGQTWSNGSGLPIGNWRNIVYDSSNTKFVAVALQGVKIIAGTAACASLQFTTGTNTITRVTGSFITDGYLTGQKIVVSGTTNNNGVKTITGTVNATTMTVTEALTNEGALSSLATINSQDGDGTAFSSDGETWSTGTPTTPLTAARWISIETNGSGRCITIANDTVGQIVAYTDDGGTNWTTVTLPLIATWSSISYGSSGNNFHRWVAVCTNVANAAYSDDNGLTWSLGPMTSFVWSSIKWAPFPVHTNDAITIQRGAIITVDTNQHSAPSSIPITNGKLLIKNTSTTVAKRFVTARTSGAAAQAITPADGLGTIDIQGNWIQIGTGDNSANQTMTVPYTDYVSALWVETGVGTGIYEIWLNVSGAYGGTLKQYQDGLLDVGTGSRGKFFIQTPNAVQDKYITATATTTFGLFSVLLDSVDGIYQGASITGQGIPANTLIEKIPRITATLGRTLTFATDETITSSSGSFLLDGFEVGDSLVITGTASNDGTYPIAAVSATVLTVTGSLAAEGPLSDTANIKVNKVILNQLPVSPGVAYTASGYTNISVKITNPYSSQFTDEIVFGDGVNGNKLTNGVKVRIPNIMITSDTPAILHTSSQTVGCYFNLGSGGNMLVDTCLFDESYHNWNQAQQLTITNVGMHIRPALTETYALTVDGWGLAMPAVRRYNTTNLWLARDIRDNLTNSLLMNYISNAIFNNVVMVLQAPHAVTAASITAPTGMFNLAYSDVVTVTNMRMYSLNTTRAYQCGLALIAPVTNSTFTNIEFYGGPMLSSQFSSSNTFTNLINSETMFSHSHNYTAGMRVTHDPTTQADLVADTKYYYKSRTFFTRDRTQYNESRVYEATPFKGSTYFPDYVRAYLNAPQSVTFGWTHRTPMYTAETSPLSNANAKNFLEIYRGTTPGFTKNLAAKVAGFNNAPSISIPTIVVWATDTRTLTLSSSGGYTITASSGSFLTDGFAVGQKLTIRGATTHANNKTYTISDVTATVITVSESITTEPTYTQDLSIVAKYIPTPKLFLTATATRTLAFTKATVTASARNLTFGGTVALPSKAPTMTAAGGNQLQFFRSTSTITSSASTFVTDGFLTGDKIYITGTTSNNTMPGNYFTLSAVAAGTLTVTAASDFLADEGPISVGTISAIRTTISCSSGSFITDGFIIGDKVKVTGTTYNNTSGTNYLTATAVAATMLTFANDLIFPEGPLASTATLTASRVVAAGASPGSFVTDGYAPGDIVEVTGSANAGNNNTFTVLSVATLYLTFIETTTTQAAEASGATLTTKILPIPKVVFLNASPNREIAFQKSVAQAATTTRIMTFDSINRNIRATGTVPGNFITEGFMIGDKISVTNTTYNNKVVFTITAVTATLITLGTTDRVFDETSTTATLTANRIKATTGSFLTDVWAVGDTVTVTGTTSNNGTYTINNVVALALSLTSNVVNETLSYRTGAVITATKLITRQKIYGTAARTFTTTAAAKTLTLSSGSMLQDGYIVGDKVLVSGMGTDGNHIYTISTLTTVILTWLEAAAPTTSLVNANAVTWVHTGYRPTILGNAASQTWDAVNKYLTLGTGTWDTTYNFRVGDKILVTGQKYNNGLFTIGAISTNRITVDEPVIHDPAVYSAAGNIIYGYSNPQKRTITASGTRTWLFDNISKKLTASSGSFILDGYYVGDCVQISGTPGGVNDGYFTISGLSATIMYFNELVYPISVAITATATLSAPDIADDTDYYYVVRKYDDTDVYNDSPEIYVKSTWQEPVTNLCLQGSAYSSANKLATLHATAARTLAFAATTNVITASSGSFTTDTYAVGDKIRITRTASNNGYYTLIAVGTTTMTTLENLVTEAASATTGAITNIYWDNMKVPVLTASAVRTLQFTTATSTGRTMAFSVSTITCLSGSFITDGFITGDKIIITGTSANNGIFTVTGTVNALTMTVTESFVTESTASTTIMIRCRKITLAGTTPGSFVTDGYSVNDRITVAGSTSNNATFTIATVETTKITVYEAIVAEGPLNATATITTPYMAFTAATRISPFLSHASTQTAESIMVTSVLDNATLTQPISTAIDNDYTFSVWVATQPTILKVATLTAAAARTFKFDGLSLTAAGGRTLQWSSSGNTITASTGSFHSDGYAVGDKLIVTGTSSNDGTFTITTLTATVITVAETLVNEGPLSATATIKVNKITAYGTTPGNFIENGFQIGDKIQTGGSGTPPAGSLYNIGWFTITNVLPNIINVAETIVTEATATSVLTITNNFHDNFTIDGEIRFGTAVQAFTATPLWQKVSVTFTATSKLHNAVIQIDTQKRGLCIYGAMVNTGSTALPYLNTTTAPVTIANKVRDITLARAWCRSYGDAPSHSGVEIQLAAAVTNELWTEVYCGTTANFTPTFINKVFDTWAGSGQTIIFNNESTNNTVDGFSQSCVCAPTNYGLVYFAAASSGNRIMNLTYDLHGATQLYLASFNTQSNNQSFYNWNIKHWRNYASVVGNAAIFQTSNATSGLTAENIFLDNSDLPIMNNALNFVIKGLSGGNVKPLNSALLYNMPVTPVYTLANTPSATVNFDSVTSALTATNYTTVYDTIFNELYFTPTTGALHLLFNASSKAVKPYVLSGNASFSNSGRLYLITAGDSVEYTWPHKILGISAFRNIPFLLDGVDLGNTLSLLEGLKIEYKIDTGSGYGANWAEATPASLSALTLSPTLGFYLKLKITAMAGMKYSTVTKPFVVGETIRGLSSLATAVVDRDFYYPVQGTVWLSSISGTFVPGETIVKDSNGEMRCINVATNTTFALFPSVTSYIDGLQIYTTVDQTAKYPANVATITLTNIVPGSLYYIFNSDTNALVAQGTATGTPAPGETTIDVSTTIEFENPFDITVNVRKSSAPVKYLPYATGSTVTADGANVFIAQIIDTVVMDSYGSIGSDWTVTLTPQETIKHTSGTTVYTVKELYSYLQDYFDELGFVDDQIPLSASTPTEYNLINGWFIDDNSFKYLSGGSVASNGQDGEIYLLTCQASGYINAVSGDVGKTVHNSGSTHTGILVDFDNTARKWWVKKVTGIIGNEALTITSGTGAGTTTSVITGESVWSNIFTLGTLVSGTTLDVYQNDSQLTPWWSSGHIDILVKVKESGTLIDTGNLTVLARDYTTYGSLYDHFIINAPSGRNPVPLAEFADGNNQTAPATVGAYSGFVFTFGHTTKDLNNGNGLQPYDCVIDCNNHTILEIYEYLKYVTRSGSATTLNGVAGEYYTGTGDIRFAYDTESSGPFSEGERINGTGSAYGYLVSLYDNGASGFMVLRNVHGTFANNMNLTGVTSGATALVDGSVTTITPQKQAPFGSYAGGQFFGARGVFLENVATADANNFQLIDSLGATQIPPAFISITISGLETGDVVSVFRTTGNNKIIDKNYLHSHSTNNSSATTSWEVDASTPIPADTPASGVIRLVKTSTKVEERIAYSSWTGNIFTLSATHSGGYDGTDTAYVPYIDKTTASTTESVSITYVPGRYIYSLVRHSGIIPFDVKGEISASGYSLTAIRTVDTIVS